MHYHYGPTDEVPSSPPAITASPASSMLLSPTRSSRRERRNPSVTPRRFGRFFTPRSSLTGGGRKILGMLDDGAVNHRGQLASPQSLFSDALGSDAILPPSPSEGRSQVEQTGRKRRLSDSQESPSKRRRGTAADEMPPPPLNLPGLASQSPSEGRKSPDGSLGEKRRATLNLFFKVGRNGTQPEAKSSPRSKNPAVDPKAALMLGGYEPRAIRKFGSRGGAAHLLDREHGFSTCADKHHLAFPAFDPRAETSSFYSRSIDTHRCATAHRATNNAIPFSLASCHRSPVTAVGDEEGFVRLFNTTVTSNPGEAKVDTFIPVHDNAIMDLAFSQDDMRLATASGDRSGRIVDIVTESVAVELGGGHWDSLRQVCFQPGQANGTILATSDRAGRIQAWDLRCSSAPVGLFSAVEAGGVRARDTELERVQGKTTNTIESAHERRSQGTSTSASVTAIRWMPEGREHLLLSACEANASIKLWDMRYIKPRRQAEEVPVAVTPEPRGHGWRSYGITSLALSSDASRLYALCRDSTVYAYSTSHLMLGQAPELRDGAAKRRPAAAEGLGPLYGFKHGSFRAQSFYVKCSIRPGMDGRSEMLAVGSTDGCAVLFPTDERYLRGMLGRGCDVSTSFSGGPSTPSASGGSFSAGIGAQSLPISRAGTPLIRGHSREVTTLDWTYDGKLVTASDDYIIRQWQEDEGRARHLRQVGEFGGERHMAGWAEVGDDWDECDG